MYRFMLRCDSHGGGLIGTGAGAASRVDIRDPVRDAEASPEWQNR
jgi:hypothetical protein